RLVRVNLYGVFNCYQAAARQMIEHGTGGKSIGAASIAAYKGFEMLGGYSVTKWGVRGLTQVAAQEWARHGITVNAYCPGIVGTAMWDLIDEKMTQRTGEERGAAMKRFSESIALGRVERPEDVAAFVSYLASRGSDCMTGQSVLIDGGIIYSWAIGTAAAVSGSGDVGRLVALSDGVFAIALTLLALPLADADIHEDDVAGTW